MAAAIVAAEASAKCAETVDSRIHISQSDVLAQLN